VLLRKSCLLLIKKFRVKIIDISLPIDDKAFEIHRVSIDRVSHKEGIDKFNRLLMSKALLGKIKFLLGKRLIKKEEFPQEEFLSLEIVHSPVHIGTHLDYSFHYGSSSEGRRSKYSEEIPLEWCYQDAAKLDFSHKKSAQLITAQDIKQALEKISYRLKPLDIVLFYTGADKFFGKPQYFTEYPGIDISAIDYLLDRGIKIFGVDTMGIDRPYKYMLSEYLKTRDIKCFYPAHFYGRKREFIHIERLANLDKLPSCGFKVSCFPVKIRQTGAAWCRAVAFINE